MVKKTGKKTKKIVIAHDIQENELAEIMSDKYLSYALSTIMSRSLPDVRDGLKPVHRRVLFAMMQLSLKPEGQPKKCARVVGDVIGKFHPHGDQSVYDALARLAQDFSVRYPLVYGQGNFGNIDGDNPAAMRYTEAKLTEVSQLLLEGINEDAIDFRFTYDGETKEPVVLPANFPNILSNGATGIAVGMATSIPPHNVAEICTALELLIDAPKSEVKDVLTHIKGPDFPTGGILVESKESIRHSYETGRGSFRLRARWEVEKLKSNNWQIVVTEIPYQVQKSRLIEKMADLIFAKKLPFLDDIIDESAEDVRVVLTPKNKTISPELLMEQLFRLTDLENRFSLNMNVLDNGITPRVMDLKEVLVAFINHRQDVLIRRSKHRLANIEHRLEVLSGLLIAYLNIDEIIKIIRFADDPKAKMKKKFKLTDVQVDSILNMRLRALRKLEEIEIKREHGNLEKEKIQVEKILGSKSRQMTIIKKQIKEIGDQFSQKTELGKRRTKIGKAVELVEIPADALIEKEPITIVCSQKGWIRTMKGHWEDDKIKALVYKDGDKEKFTFHAQTTDKIITFATNGKFYTLIADKLPSGRGFGEPIRLMIELPSDADVLTMQVHDENRKLLIVSDDGRGFIVEEKEILSQTKNGKRCLNVKKGAEAKICVEVADNADHIAVIGQNRKLLIFPIDEVPELTKGVGVILQRYKDGGVSDAKAFKKREGLSWYSGGRNHVEKKLKPWIGERAQAGRLPPNGFPRSNKFGRV